MRRRWSPKDWPAPKSRRTRHGWLDEHGELTTVSFNLILRDHYPANGGRPWWAKLARKHGWMSDDDYYAVPEEDGPSPLERLVYAEFPLFRLMGGTP